MFNAVDFDHSGTIDVDEIHQALRTRGLRLERDEIEQLIAGVDSNSDGNLSFDEFIQGLERAGTGRDRAFEVWSHRQAKKRQLQQHAQQLSKHIGSLSPRAAIKVPTLKMNQNDDDPVLTFEQFVPAVQRDTMIRSMMNVCH